MQKKESTMTVWHGWKNLSLGITVGITRHSLVMPNSDTRDRFFHPHQTIMKDSYNLPGFSTSYWKRYPRTYCNTRTVSLHRRRRQRQNAGTPWVSWTIRTTIWWHNWTSWGCRRYVEIRKQSCWNILTCIILHVFDLVWPCNDRRCPLITKECIDIKEFYYQNMVWVESSFMSIFQKTFLIPIKLAINKMH